VNDSQAAHALAEFQRMRGEFDDKLIELQSILDRMGALIVNLSRQP
jgi:hypothetical protein